MGYLVTVSSKEVKKIHLEEISTIVLESNDCYISSYLLKEIAKHNILLISCDEKHNPIGEFLPLYGNYRSPKNLQKQFAWGAVIKKQTWQQIIIHKIKGQAAVLSSYDNVVSDLLDNYSKQVKSGDSTYLEATAAAHYFKVLFGENFNRQQDNDVNASLNYGYSILLSFVNRQIIARGYVTQVGICHKNEFNQFNLGCDFMEPFRPFVDYIVLNNFKAQFDQQLRLILVNMFNSFVIYNNGKYKMSSVICSFIDDCFRSLNKKIEPKSIKGFNFVQ